jgi:hypothetical protein
MHSFFTRRNNSPEESDPGSDGSGPTGSRNICSKGYLEVAEPDPTRQTRPTRPDPNPTRDQMAFNPIEIYQRSEKTQHVN